MARGADPQHAENTAPDRVVSEQDGRQGKKCNHDNDHAANQLRACRPRNFAHLGLDRDEKVGKFWCVDQPIAHPGGGQQHQRQRPGEPASAAPSRSSGPSSGSRRRRPRQTTRKTSSAGQLCLGYACKFRNGTARGTAIPTKLCLLVPSLHECLSSSARGRRLRGQRPYGPTRGPAADR